MRRGQLRSKVPIERPRASVATPIRRGDGASGRPNTLGRGHKRPTGSRRKPPGHLDGAECEAQASLLIVVDPRVFMPA